MALFGRRKARDEALASTVAEQVAKALTPAGVAAIGGTTTLPSEPTMAQNLLQTPGSVAAPLPRMGDFLSQMGPAQPLLPAPLDVVDPVTGRALPRVFQYDVAWNLNLTDKLPGWNVLKNLAEQCDVIHRCIEIRIAEIVGLQWDIAVSDHAISEVMAEQNVGHAKAAQIARLKYAESIDRLKRFWENPYTRADGTFSEWITEAAYQHYIFDGLAVYPRYSLGKDVMGFEIIDTPTIKCLLDDRGDIPAPPAPAYQQILWGFPRGEYQRAADSDGEFYAGEGSGEFVKDQLAYFVRNRRTWTPYGFSAVEQSIPAAMLYLERQRWLKSEYTEGTQPLTYFETDSDEMDHLKLAAWERGWNDRMTGQTAERHRHKVLPRGFKPTFAPTVDERYKAEYDEFVLKQIGSKFGVAPTQLGVIPRTGLGGRGQMQGEQDQAETMSQRPTEQWFTDVINALNRRFLGADRAVTFVFTDPGNPTAQKLQAEAALSKLTSGQTTLNELKASRGEPLYDMPEADEPFLLAGNTITFLKGMLEAQNTPKPAPVIPAAPVDPSQASQPPQDPAVEETKKFESFVAKRLKSGTWRDFTFEHVDAETAKILNESGRDRVLPKADARFRALTLTTKS